MAANDTLTRFVHEALSAGRSRDEIREALLSAGWSERETREALEAFAAIPFSPPVPRPVPQLTARDTFVYLILFSSLGFVAIYLTSLIHAILDMTLADASNGTVRPSYGASRIRLAIAVLLVATPVFAWMTLHTRRQIAEDAGRRRSPVRKWLTYMALFCAALTFFGTATMVIYAFLDGEATRLFVLKALTIAGISGAIFGFYIRDTDPEDAA